MQIHHRMPPPQSAKLCSLTPSLLFGNQSKLLLARKSRQGAMWALSINMSGFLGRDGSSALAGSGRRLSRRIPRVGPVRLEKGVRATSSEPDLTFSNCPSPTIRHSLNYRLQLSRPTLKTTSQRMPDRARSIIQPKLIEIRRCLTSCHDLLKHLELSGCVKGHQVHAPIPAEIPSVEPVPVLQERELALLGSFFKAKPHPTCFNYFSKMFS